MPQGLSIEVEGQVRLFVALDELEDRFADSRPWDEHKKLRLKRQAEHLDTKGSGRWEPLKPSTVRRKERDPRASFLEILQRTGRLYFSATREGAPFNVTVETRDEFVEGTTDPVALIHHEGIGKVPVREVLHVSDEEVARHAQLFVARKEREARLTGFEVVRG